MRVDILRIYSNEIQDLVDTYVEKNVEDEVEQHGYYSVSIEETFEKTYGVYADNKADALKAAIEEHMEQDRSEWMPLPEPEKLHVVEVDFHFPTDYC